MSVAQEQYTIRRQVFRLFGAGFHIYDAADNVVGFCEQKAFKLREDLRLYRSDAKTDLLIRIAARQIIDFNATYDVFDAQDQRVGSLRRRGGASLLRDTWLVFDAADQQVAQLTEESGMLAALRRFTDLGFLFPEQFELTGDGNTPLATYRTHFNPFIYRLSIAIHPAASQFDPNLLLATGVLIAAIEGRQG
ncbi:MAG: hypothetical protein SFY96_08495 [Planctomycetota bacterium]|nr:hypothetical protein [Planctomycetota bacterium]